MTSDPPAERLSAAPTDPWQRLGLVVLLLVCALAYAPVVGAGFVWDDIPLVVRNRVLDEPGALATLFTQSLWASSSIGDEGMPVAYYRPLMMVSLWFDRQLFGLEPWGYHLHSLAWHLVAVAGAWMLARRLLPASAATVAAACFALHPVQSEAVVWVAARNDSMAAAFGLWALVLVTGERLRVGHLFGAGLLTLCAGLTKESVVLLPVLLGVLQLAQGRLGVKAWLPLVIGILGTLAARVAAGVPGSGVVEVDRLSFLLGHLHHVLGILGASLVSPWPLSGARSLEWGSLEPAWRLGLGWLTWMLLLAGALLWRGRERRVVQAGLLWLVLSLGPVLLPIASTGQLGERYLYLPMVGVGWMLGAVCARVPMVALVGLSVPWVLILGLRIPDWQSDRSLWTAAVRDIPGPMSWAGLAHIDRLEGRDQAALEGFMAAVDHPIPNLSACTQVVGTALALGRPEVADQLGAWTEARGCRQSTEVAQWLGQWAVARVSIGDWAGAQELLGDAPVDPTGRGDVARAALALRSADAEALAVVEARWPDPASLRVQAVGLLERGEAVRLQLDRVGP